jgi:2-polyprenyl-6-methoxyphenol hydroxylase-like FAD-dependent oxidoreductase
VGGFIPASSVLNEVEPGSMNFVFGGNGFFGYFFSDSSPTAPHRDSPYHVSAPGSQLAWWSTYAVGPECPTPKTLDMIAVTRQLRERHGSWKDPVIQKVLNQLTVDHMWPTWTVPALPKWHREGVVLVGDAAHALPPTSGQGSSQALEDCEAFALFLAHQLQKSDGAIAGDESVTGQKKTITKAAQQYEDLRKPHVAAIMKEAQKMQSNKRDMGFLQERLMYAFLWLMGECCCPVLSPSSFALFCRFANNSVYLREFSQSHGEEAWYGRKV